MEEQRRGIVVAIKRLVGERTGAEAVEVMLPKGALMASWLNGRRLVEDLGDAATDGEIPLYLPHDCPDGLAKVLARCLRAMCSSMVADAEPNNENNNKRKIEAIYSVSDVLEDAIDRALDDCKAAAMLKALLDVAIKEDMPALYRAVLSVTSQTVMEAKGGWLVRAMLADDGWEALKAEDCAPGNVDGVDGVWAPLLCNDDTRSVRSKLAQDAVLRLIGSYDAYCVLSEVSLKVTGNKRFVSESVKELVDEGTLRPDTSLREPWAVDAMADLIRHVIHMNKLSKEVTASTERVVEMQSRLVTVLQERVRTLQQRVNALQQQLAP